MPDPITLETFRQIASSGSDRAVYLDNAQQVSAAPRFFGGRLVQHFRSERLGREHIGTELLRRLEEQYGAGLARKAFLAVRRELHEGPGAELGFVGRKALTTRQIREILQQAESLSREQGRASVQALLAEVQPFRSGGKELSPTLKAIAAEAGVDLAPFTAEHWLAFEQLMEARLQDDAFRHGVTPTPDEARAAASRLLSHLAGVGSKQLRDAATLRQELRQTGLDLLDAVSGRAGKEANPAFLLGRLLEITRGQNAYTAALLAGKQEVGGDDLDRANRMAISLAVSSLSPALAGRILQGIEAPGSEFRHLMVANSLSLNDPHGRAEGAAHTAVVASIANALSTLYDLLANRAGAPVRSTDDVFQAAASLGVDSNWQTVHRTGFTAVELQTAGLDAGQGSARVLALVERLAAPQAQLRQSLLRDLAAAALEEEQAAARAAVEDQEDANQRDADARESSRKQISRALIQATFTHEKQLSEAQRAALWETSEALRSGGRSVFDIASRLAGVSLFLGRGVLAEVPLTEDDLVDAQRAEFYDRAEPLDVRHLAERPHLVLPGSAPAQALYRDYCATLQGLIESRSDWPTDVRDGARALLGELTTQHGPNGDIDFSPLIQSFKRSPIPIGSGEFRVLTARLLELFPKATAAR